MNPRSDLVLDPVVTPGVLSAKLWIRRGSGCDQQGQRGGHQLLGSVLSRGCGPLDQLQLADLVEGCGAGDVQHAADGFSGEGGFGGGGRVRFVGGCHSIGGCHSTGGGRSGRTGDSPDVVRQHVQRLLDERAVTL